LTKGQKVVDAYRYKGLQGGAVIGFFVGLILVVQTFEAGMFDLEKLLVWTSVTSIIFALLGWLFFGGTSGLTGYDDSSSGSGDSGSDGGGGGE
jgi:hypothetical protein